MAPAVVTGTFDLIARTIIRATQVQGVYVEQLVSVDCDTPERADGCLDCIRFHQSQTTTTLDPTTVEERCAACSCDLSGVNLQTDVVCDFLQLQATDIDSRIDVSLRQEIDRMTVEGGLPPSKTDDRDKICQDISTDLKVAIQNEQFQSAIQSLRVTQAVKLTGAGSIRAVDMRAMVNMVSRIVQESGAFTQVEVELTASIIEVVSKMMNTVVSSISLWVVRIVLYLVVGLLVYASVRSSLSLLVTSATA